MNVKLLRKVAKHILAEPRRFQMSTWVCNGVPGSVLDEYTGHKFAQCGTAACIGGWATILSKMERGDEERALDITYEQGQRLFYVSAWPNKFGDKFQDSGKKQDARIAAARIEHFIRTKGKE